MVEKILGEQQTKDIYFSAMLTGLLNEKQAAELVIVTNEIFSDGIVYEEETIRYQEYLGRINREIAKKAATVVEVVYGIPVVQKQAGGE